MATVKAGFKRLIKTGDFENLTVELGVEMESTKKTRLGLADDAGSLYQQLSLVGDKLVADALRKTKRRQEKMAKGKIYFVLAISCL